MNRLIELLNKKEEQLTVEDIINIYGNEREELQALHEQEYQDHVELSKLNPSAEDQIDFRNRWNEIGFYK